MLEQNIAPIVDRLNIAKRVLLEKKGFFVIFLRLSVRWRVAGVNVSQGS